ncbi:hypothetical protein GUJ93_ZPchr0009g1297 [Zizania palustris]|uniref:Late embryogenesis abundant protein LEA-2 subgroup domain-containing protein n=1 Tax=Zizania palustris TaxID=103762 RepID=A0A8J5S675_ZIZPA|nr:hypothetical protein GUJ93_ZPchr0009g1297 [Zizania palustris]
MADRVHPMSASPSSTLPQDHVAATETTPLHPSFRRTPPPPPGTYIVQIPKDQVIRVPPPDRARRYKKLAARPVRRRRVRRACCALLGTVLLLVLLAAAFVGVVYLVFRPRAPSFSVTSLSIRGLDVLAPSSSSLSPQIDAAVRADNGANKKAGIDYRDGGEVTISYYGEHLAAGQWPAFYQAPNNVTLFSTVLTGKGVGFTEDQRKRLAAEQAAGKVPLTVEATVPVRVRFGKVLRTWTVDVKSTCQVTVDKLADKAAAAENRGCRIKVRPLWWWW